MKKVICAFLCFVLVVLLCACGAPDDAHSDNNTSEITQTEHTTTEQVVTTTEKYTVNDVMNSIRAFLNPDMSHKISFEYMNLALYGFSRDIEQKLCKDGSFSYFVSDHQWDHTSGYDNTESREFYYRYEDEAFVCYMKDSEGEISHVEVSQKVIDSMAADKVKIVSAEALVPSYAQAFTEVLEGAQYTFLCL
ncbi:MAG: hypothetical protein E7566_08210 [Ruminococcaceae bacterium]|nr:hypothetical protein [Oscillospiraceae bacterium]